MLTSASLDPTLSMNSWLSKLESSGWLDHVQIILSTAYYAAQCLDVQGNEIQALSLETLASKGSVSGEYKGFWQNFCHNSAVHL